MRVIRRERIAPGLGDPPADRFAVSWEFAAERPELTSFVFGATVDVWRTLAPPGYCLELARGRLAHVAHTSPLVRIAAKMPAGSCVNWACPELESHELGRRVADAAGIAAWAAARGRPWGAALAAGAQAALSGATGRRPADTLTAVRIAGCPDPEALAAWLSDRGARPGDPRPGDPIRPPARRPDSGMWGPVI
jgi:hypothetical protein